MKSTALTYAAIANRLNLSLVTFYFLLFTSFLFLNTPTANAQWTQVGADIDGEAAEDFSGYSVSMPDSSTIAIGAVGNDGNGNFAGHVRIYKWNGTTWVQKGADIDGEAADDNSGHSVSMPDSNTIAIGAIANDGNGSNSGHVRVYEWNGSAWIQKGIDIDGQGVSDQFGFAVSMPDANTLAAGAIQNDNTGSDAGNVRIYEWNGTTWIQKGSDINGEATGDNSGYSVSMPDVNTVAIGARFNDGTGTDAGHVRIYEWNGTAWIQKGMDIDGEAAGDYSGYTVSMPTSTTIAIGAYFNDGNGSMSGHTRIYEWNGATWVQKGNDIDGDAAFTFSGHSVSMPDIDIVAIGATNASGNGSGSGNVRIYEWNGTAWIQKGLDIDGEVSQDNSGYSVSMSGINSVAVSAYLNDGNGSNSGHARVFNFSTCALTASITSQNNISCNGLSDGSLTVSASGGTANFTYDWSNGSSTSNLVDTFNTISSLPAGTYTVTVTDNNACTATATTSITEPTNLTAFSIVDSNVTCNGFSDGGATASATGGTAPYTYTWNNTASTASITGVAANAYFVTVTDNNGCTDSASVTITQPASVVASASVSSPLDCNGDMDGIVQANASGGTSPYTYNWNTGETSSIESNLGIGTYFVTITDANGCTDSTSVTLSQPTQLVASAVETSPISCNGLTDGVLTASAVGGTTPYTYSWNDGSTNAVNNNSFLGANDYFVTITDANGCTDSASVTLTEPAALSGSITSQTNINCNGESTGSATVAGSGGTTPYTYSWSSGEITASISGKAAGNYTVSITDANNCGPYIEFINLSQPASALVASAIVDSNVTCNGFSDGGATASATGGTAPYTYTWNNTASAASITGVAANAYFVTVTDNNGCTDSASVTITQPASVVASASVSSPLDCNGDMDGVVQANASGGTGAYTYSWNTGETSSIESNLGIGTYFVTITDANGCTDSASVTLSQPTLLVASIPSTTNASCNGNSDGSATASATGGTAPYTYSWSNGSSVATANSLTASTYTVTVTDANGCTDETNTIITQPTTLGSNITSQSNISCNGESTGSTAVAGSGGTTPYTYSWSSGETTASISGKAAGNYTVSITDANNCGPVLEFITLSQPASALVASAIVDSNATCSGFLDGGATASATGGTAPYTYTWNNTASTASITGVAANAYFVTVTDNNGCTDSASVTITEPSALVASSVVNNNASGAGIADGAATASASGGTAPYTYLWNDPGNTTTAAVTGLLAGTYTVTVTDNNSCSATATSTITEPGAITLMVDSTDISCNGILDGTATATASGGVTPYTYNWSTMATTASIINLGPGTYTVTLTDNNGVTAIGQTTVNEPSALVGSTVVDSNVTCFGLADGGATASASGGTAPYTYNWSGQSNQEILFAVAAGVYTVTITDANGCSVVETETITEPTALANSIVTTSETCSPGSDGSATATTTGGTAPYTYVWSNMGGTPTISNLVAGSYTVTVTDANGCSLTDVATVSSSGNPSISFVTTDVSCNGGADGSIATTVSSGTTPFTFTWNPTLPNTPNQSALTAGSYNLTVTDANGCSDVGITTINEPTAVVASVAVDSNASCFNSTDGGLTASATGGSVPYTYNWSNAATTASLTGIAVGVYTVTVTDANGCTSTNFGIINSDDNVKPVARAKDTTLYLDFNGQRTVLPADIDSGSTDNCSIASFQVLNANMDCSDIGANIVRLIAVDTDGNRDTAVSIVTILDTIKPTIIAQNITVYIADSNRRATITAADVDNGTADNCSIASLSISKSVFNCGDAGPNTIFFSAVDVNGNSDTTAVIVTVLDTLTKDSAVTLDTACGSYTWSVNNQTYNLSGIYNDTLRNNFGCDSIYRVLDLEINSLSTFTDTVVACDTFTWQDGNTYTSSNNTATYVLTNSVGCDSVITLDLTLNNSSTGNQSAVECVSYTWPENGQTYNTTGMYSTTITNTQNCDSVITLDLEIRPLRLNVINVGDSVFAFEDHPNASYKWYSCDGDSLITGATSRGFKPDTTGFYSVIVGNGICSDTSACTEVIFIGLDEQSAQIAEIGIYPNPTNQDFFFEVDRVIEQEDMIIFDMNGKVIWQQNITQLKTKIQTEGWNAGIYFVRYQDQMKKLVLTR